MNALYALVISACCYVCSAQGTDPMYSSPFASDLSGTTVSATDRFSASSNGIFQQTAPQEDMPSQTTSPQVTTPQATTPEVITTQATTLEVITTQATTPEVTTPQATSPANTTEPNIHHPMSEAPAYPSTVSQAKEPVTLDNVTSSVPSHIMLIPTNKPAARPVATNKSSEMKPTNMPQATSTISGEKSSASFAKTSILILIPSLYCLLL